MNGSGATLDSDSLWAAEGESRRGFFCKKA